MHVSSPAPDLYERRQDLGRVFCAIVAVLLAKDPDDRYQSAGALHDDLDRIDELEALTGDGSEVVLGTHAEVQTGRAITLVGRDTELANLKEVWNGVRSGRGEVVLVEGPGGSGKTRLVRELRDSPDLSGALVLRSKCQASQQAPFGVIRDAIDGHLVTVLRSAPAERDKALERVRRAAGGFAQLVRRLSRTLRLALKESRGSVALEAAQDQNRFFTAVADFFVALARISGPTLLLIDDAHWLDEASRQVLVRVAAQLDDVPLLLAMTARNDAASQESVQKLRAALSRPPVTVPLGPLDANGASDLLRMHLGGLLPEGVVVDQIIRRADGNPFAIGEYLRTLLDAGAIRPEAGKWVVENDVLANTAMPAEVLQLVLARINTVSDTARKLLAAASIGGATFRARLLVKTMGTAPAEVARGLDECVQAHLLERIDEDRYNFVHDRIREALEPELSEQERRDLHQSMAEQLDAVGETSPEIVYQLAHHYVRGHTERTPRRLFETSLAAGKLALDAFANQDALVFLGRAEKARAAVELEGPQIRELRETLGQACIRVAKIREAIHNFRAALGLAEDRATRVRLHVQLARVQLAIFNEDGVERECKKALAEAGIDFESLSELPPLTLPTDWWTSEKATEPPPLDAARINGLQLTGAIYAMWALMRFLSGREDVVAVLAPRLAGVLRELGQRPEAIDLLGMFAILLSVNGRHEDALRAHTLAIGLAERRHDQALVVNCKYYEAYSWLVSGRFANLVKSTRELIYTSARWMNARPYSVMFTAVGIACFLNGVGVAEAKGELVVGVAAADASGIPVSKVNNRAALAACEALLGQGSEAITHLEEAFATAQRIPAGDIWSKSFLLKCAAFVHFELDHLDRLEEIIAKFDDLGRAPTKVPAFSRYYYVIVAHARRRQLDLADPGQWAGVLSAFERAVADLGQVGTDSPFRRCHLHFFDAVLARTRGQWTQAGALLDKVLLETESPDGFEDAWARFEIGCERARLAKASGSVADATRHAQWALDLAMRSSWRGRAQRVRTEFDLFASRERSSSAFSAGRSRDVLSSSRFLAALLRLSHASATAIDPMVQARAILDETVKVFGAERAFLFSMDGSGRPKMQLGRNAHGRDLAVAKRYSASVVRAVAEKGKPVIVTRTEEGAVLGAESVAAHELRSIMAASLRMGDRTLGILYLDSRVATGPFSDEDLAVLQGLANHIAINLEIASAARPEV
jgi:tetratricopeptide (TPR) repeat protein